MRYLSKGKIILNEMRWKYSWKSWKILSLYSKPEKRIMDESGQNKSKQGGLLPDLLKGRITFVLGELVISFSADLTSI